MRGPAPHTIVMAILSGAGVMHFVAPKPFDSLIPSWMPGPPRAATYGSGVCELLSAALVAVPRTRRAGGALALATFIGVFPANIWAALDGGMKEAPAPLDTALAAWLRLPFQLPLFWLAWKTMRSAQRKHSKR
jgi:uncharacterized membrane protein